MANFDNETTQQFFDRMNYADWQKEAYRFGQMMDIVEKETMKVGNRPHDVMVNCYHGSISSNRPVYWLQRCLEEKENKVMPSIDLNLLAPIIASKPDEFRFYVIAGRTHGSLVKNRKIAI